MNQTIMALDEMIEFGLGRIAVREEEVKQATDVKKDIDEIRDELVENSKKRIDRIDQDLRVAMEYSAGQLLREGNKKVNFQKEIAASFEKLSYLEMLINSYGLL